MDMEYGNEELAGSRNIISSRTLNTTENRKSDILLRNDIKISQLPIKVYVCGDVMSLAERKRVKQYFMFC